MKSHINERFREALAELPKSVQRQARRAFSLFKQDPFHNSLQFKLIDSDKQIYSVRIGLHYRALRARDRDVIKWFWIGSHADYDKMISQL